jgi:hypothetical protein
LLHKSYFAEFFCIAAAAASLYAAYAKTIIPLRIAAIAANFLAMIYSLSHGTYPTFLLNAALLPLNGLAPAGHAAADPRHQPGTPSKRQRRSATSVQRPKPSKWTAVATQRPDRNLTFGSTVPIILGRDCSEDQYIGPRSLIDNYAG